MPPPSLALGARGGGLSNTCDSRNLARNPNVGPERMLGNAAVEVVNKIARTAVPIRRNGLRAPERRA